MSQENVERVRALYECFARGDFRASSDLLGPDFEWEQLPGAGVEPGSHHGSDAVRAVRSIFEVYENFRVEAEECIDAGDKVVVVARCHGKARASGMQLDEQLAFVWAVRDGKPTRMEQHPSRREALESVGLAA
jgi:ketosteroid isomerase-like protein